ILLDDMGNPVKSGGQDVLDPDFEPDFCAPLIKIVIGDTAPDNSVVPTSLRPLPVINSRKFSSMPTRYFELQRGGAGGEIEWLINGRPFDPEFVAATPNRGVP